LGQVGQSFCHALNLELSEYFRLVAVLSAQVDHDAETRQRAGAGVSALTLRKLLVWVHDPLEKLRLIARLIDSVDGLRGGALASAIHSHVLHGDPAVREYVQNVLKAVAAPIFRMIQRWVFEGELDDIHVSHAFTGGHQFALTSFCTCF
jgi:gamma-tubulin complex component 3